MNKDRYRAVVHWYSGQSGLKQYEIALKLGFTSKVYFSQLLNGQKEIPSSFLNKLCSLDPRINPAYLTGESEEMLLSSDLEQRPVVAPPPPPKPKVTEQGNIVIPKELASIFTSLSATVQSQQELIAKLTEHLTNK